MHLEAHVHQVAEQMRDAAALGDDRTREIATGLATATSSAVRLALLAAVSAAADEITAALLDYPGSPSVSVRLDGDDVVVGVEARQAVDAEPALDERTTDPRTDDGATARISLRLPEGLKAEVDAAAERDGVSVNTWLVRAASAALRPQPAGPFGPGGPFGSGGAAGHRGGRRGGSTRITGWVTG